MGKLNLIVDDVCCVKVESKTQYADIPEDERDNNSWWYLHGKLEDFCGYDKAITTNCKSCGFSRETVDWSSIRGDNVVKVCNENKLTRWEMHLNGIVPVTVEGVDKPCVGYFWTAEEHEVYYKGKAYPHWKQRGLVVFEDDCEAREYAQKQYNEKSEKL